MGGEDEIRAALLFRPRTMAAALSLSTAYALALYLLFFLLREAVASGGGLFITLAFLIGAPVAAAAIAVLVADPRREASGREHAALGAVVVLLILLCGIALLKEGGVCTIMAAPLFFPAGILGAVAAGRSRRLWGDRVHAVALPVLPLLLLQLELAAGHPVRTEEVVDAVEIAAPASIVWEQLKEVRDIAPDELGWTFTQDVAGVPKPLDARLAGEGVGSVRHVRWGGGIRFDEEITSWQEGRHLAWRFRFRPNSIPREIEAHVRPDSDYLRLEAGSYRLEPLAGGRTRVTLTTRYSIATALNGYCAWWGRIMVGDLHRNVLRVIAGRAERNARIRIGGGRA